jgi:hypothetical protein
MDTPPPRSPTTAQVVLGLFIVGQLLFLPAANFLGMAEKARPYLEEQPPAEPTDPFEERVLHAARTTTTHVAPGWIAREGHLHDALTVLSGLTSRWSQLTGQPQDWSLFAPSVYRVATFVAVQFRWDTDGDPGILPPQLLLSDNEPDDLASFFRVGKFRLRRYEGNLDLVLSTRDDKIVEGQVDAWRERIAGKVRGEWMAMRAYMLWRLRVFRERHPGTPPPTQVILMVRVYRIPAPDEPTPPMFWPRPEQRPLARWQASREAEDGYLPIEMHNPVVERFEPLRAKD